MTAAQIQTESSSQSSSAEYRCFVLPPKMQLRAQHRNAIAALLQAAINQSAGRMSFESIYDMYHSGLVQLWVLDHAPAHMSWRNTVGAIVTEMVTTATGQKIMKVICGGGTHMKECSRVVMDAIEAFAIAENCTSVMIEGRRGWGRVYPDYKEVWTTFEKVL